MKVSDHIPIGTILAPPPVTYALRVAIARADSPSTTPYPSAYVDCWVIEINPKTGQLLSVASGCYHKEKVDELHPRLPFSTSPCGHSSQYTYSEDGGKHMRCSMCERDENLLMCELARREGV